MKGWGEVWKVRWTYPIVGDLILPENGFPSEVMAQEYARKFLDLLEEKGTRDGVLYWETIQVA